MLRAPGVLRDLAAPQLQRPTAKAAGTPAGSMGTRAGNNRTAVVSAPRCWGLFTRLVLGTESVPSSAPAAAQQEEHAADCFPRPRFPARRMKCSDFPSPQLQEGLVTRDKLLSFAVSSKFEIHGQVFFMGSVHLEKLH